MIGGSGRPPGFVRPHDDAAALGGPRWDGRPGRVEAWDATFTAAARGEGLWLHAETHAPTAGEPVARGWCAHFPRGGEPTCERFGPVRVAGPPDEPPDEADRAWFDATGVRVARDRAWGRTASLGWDLTWHDGSVPLLPFPRSAWQRELPYARVVPQPAARCAGEVDVGGRRVRWHDAVGGVAHAYGRGHPRRWAWLHADLGHGEVAEVVSVAPAGAGPGWLPPSSLVQLRAGGRDWPRAPLLAAPRLRGRLGLPAWSVSGRVGDRRLRVWVHQPSDRCVTLSDENPGGEPLVRTSTARADADVVVERRAGGRWRSEAVWQLRGTAHAGVGLRP